MFAVTRSMVGLGAAPGCIARPVGGVGRIRAGRIQNNLALKQERLEVSRVTESLHQARSLFYPRVAFNPTYSLAAGDRRLEFVDQQVAVAERNRQAASAYFNFLLNRDLTIAIQVDSTLSTVRSALEQPATRPSTAAVSSLHQLAIRNRQEVGQLGYSLAAAQTAVKLNEANAMIPTLYVGANAGFQGFGYTFRKQSYALAQIGLQRDLFRGYEKRPKIQQAKLQTSLLQTRLTELERQIQLQVIQAYYDLRAAQKSLTASQSGAVNAEQTFRILDSKYRNGQALLIEFLRVQNDRLTAQLQQSLARMDVHIKGAALDRAIAAN